MSKNIKKKGGRRSLTNKKCRRLKEKKGQRSIKKKKVQDYEK